jgi:hypothetical protein
MKKIKNLIVASFIAANAFAQQPPTPNPASDPSTGLPGPQKGTVAWYRGGNSITTPAGTANIFGTLWNSPVYHFTTGKRRMTAFDDTYSTALFGPINSTPFGGGLAIHLNPLSPIPAPKSLLTIGEDFDPMGEASSGWRKWMRVGTFNTDGSDFAYFGLKREQSLDRNDAVIAWGDDAGLINNPNIFSPDYLRFIFSSDVGLGTNVPNGQGSHGLEVARFSPFGSFGIGNYYNNTIEAPFTQNPSRRIEILSDKTVATNNGNPLFRLTHTQQNPTNTLVTGLYSEFEPRNNGDLFISVRDNTQTNTVDKILKERFTGLNTNTPGNTFEINSQFVSSTTLNGNTPAATGWAGLRFTDLKSTSVAQINPSSNVLSVDSNGDVILVPGGTGGSLGNLCGATQNPLTNNYQIPMDGFNFNYTTPANTQSSFHLGNTVCVPTLGRMNVYNDNLQITSAISSNVSLATNAIGVISNITNTGTGNSLSMQGTANTNGTGSTARGLRGEAIASNGSLAEGVKGIATSNNNCLQNIAVGGLAANGSIASISGDFDVENSNSGFNQGINVEVKLGTNAAAVNFGINTRVNTPASVNYGGYFAAAGATNNYGVYGQAPHSGGTNGPNYAGYFDGDLVYTGTFGMASDATLKTNIDTLQDAISVINQLKPKQFNFDQAGHPSMSFPNGLQYGLIAQDVETVLPNLVNNNVHPAKLDTLGNVVVPPVNFKSVEYEQLIPFLIKGMQQQQAQIKKQDSLITALSNQINSCCSNASTRHSNSITNQLNVELSDKDAIVLNQNVPNPFAEQTTITYNVPASVGKAQLIFFNTNGQVIQTVDIKTRGKGKVNVFASDLSSGLYNYSLVADGKVIDSKKMVRE